MKNIYKYILVITLMMFSFIGEVSADEEIVNSCVKNGTCDLLCQYRYIAVKYNNEIYTYNIYHYYGDMLKKGLYYSSNNGNLKKIYNTSDKKNGAENFIDPQAEIELLEKKCPVNIYFKENPSYLDVCFDSNKTYCLNNFEDYLPENYNEPGNFIPDEIKYKDEYRNKCVDEGTCLLMCSYYNFENSAYIYYIPSENKFKTSYTWSMYTIGKEYDDLYELTTDKHPAIIGPTDLENLNNGICPNNVYNDYDANMASDICFDNDGSYCTKEYNDFNGNNRENFKVEINANKEDLEKSKPKDNEMTYEEAYKRISEQFSISDIKDICSYSRKGVISPDYDQLFLVDTNSKYRLFRRNSSNDDDIIEELDSNDIEYREYCMEHLEIIAEKETLFSDFKYVTERSTLIDRPYDQKTYFLIWSNGESEDVEYNGIGNIDNCEDLLGKDLVDELNSYMLYIKIAVPIIIIVMGSIDFGRAFLASDEDAMKKAQKRFIMRLIIGMVIFFIPTIINVLLDIADSVWKFTGGNGTCGIGF